VSLAAAGQEPGARGSDHRLALAADARERGYVRLRMHSTPGVPVTIEEPGRGRVAELRPSSSRTVLRRAVRWRCEQRSRTFVATTPDGSSASARIRTPSCAQRLALVLPARARASSQVRLRMVDRWGVGGFAARVCVEPPGGPARCDRLGLREGGRSRASRFRALRPGGWRVRATTHWGHAARGVRVAAPGGSLSVLATGDSMIQRLDRFLARRLRRLGVRMRSDAHPATGISKPSTLNWVAQARRQAASAPDVVVMFIGANDAFTMGAAACCGRAWIAAYARRAGMMMTAYARDGRTRVLWLLLPTPREGFFRQSFPAVNAALRCAASGRRRDVRIVDLVEVFSPGGRYRTWIRVGDREVGVRQSDGVHLSDQGASIAANVVIRTLREERILPRRRRR
jgi:lysophospholipase L1-like esterase